MVVNGDGSRGCTKEAFLWRFWCMGIDELWSGGVMEGYEALKVKEVSEVQLWVIMEGGCSGYMIAVDIGWN